MSVDRATGTPASRRAGSLAVAHNHRASRLLAGAVVCWASTAFVADAGAAPLTGMPDTYFPIGVFYQPANAYGTTSFTQWKARGVNTLVGWEQQGTDAQGNPTVSIDQWSQAATNAGLYMMRQPRDGAAIANDAADPNVIAYLQPDEPDGRGIGPDVLTANYAQWQAGGGGKPVLLNFDGSRVLGMQGTLKQADYQAMAAGADWLAQDIYPVTGWNSPNDLKMVGRATSTLSGWVNPKPVFAYIETSNQRLFSATNPEWNVRGPTSSEMRFEIWDALIHGAKGVMYFPQSFNGFRYDATPIDNVAEMARQNTIITSLAQVLNADDPTDQYALSFDQDPQHKGALEAMVKTYNGVTYIMAVNALSDAQDALYDFSSLVPADSTLQVLGEGRTVMLNGTVFEDQFAGYGLHIYALVPDGAAALAIPEPTAAALATLAAFATLARRRRRRQLTRTDTLTPAA